MKSLLKISIFFEKMPKWKKKIQKKKSTENLQSIIKKDTKFHETNGWDNIFTLETITNVNNPKKKYHLY